MSFKPGDLVRRVKTPYVSDDTYNYKRVYIEEGTILKVISVEKHFVGGEHIGDSVWVGVSDFTSDFDGYTCDMSAKWVSMYKEFNGEAMTLGELLTKMEEY